MKPRPLLLFAPGAGAPSSSPWMKRFAERFAKFARVVAFDYPYMKSGRRAPDPLPRLIDAHRAALEAARRDHDGPVFLVGKSMGGRVGCHLASTASVDGLVCLGYPLRGQSGKLRDQVLLELVTPICFVQGSRDSLCPLDTLAEVRARMIAPNELFVVEGGNHSLELGKKALDRLGTTQSELEADLCARIRRFIEGGPPKP